MQLRNNKGFTLIEIAIVLTIVGLIIGGIWVAASTVFNNNKTQSLTKDVIQVMQNTKTLFAGQGASASTTGFAASVAVNAGIFPSDMVANATTPILVTPFSTDPTVNAVTVAAANGAGGTSTAVTYTFGNGAQGLPSSACTQLLTTLGSLTNIQKLNIFFLGGGAAPADLSGGGTTAVTAAQAAGACNAASNGNFVKVTFNVF